ncbi:MAG TPA: PAS domain S-box protein [Bacteroidales bacterium]|nr:PAS domain S-box protein [Bacteroidales bacterium]
MLRMGWIKKCISFNEQLTVDKRIANQVVAILAVTALFSGILNIMMGFPWWFTVLILGAIVLSVLYIALSVIKTKFVIPKAALIVALYVVVILLWLYNPGLSKAPVILSFAIIVFSIAIYVKNFVLLFLLNFIIVTSLVVIGVLFPPLFSFSYKNEIHRVVDVLGSYFLLGMSVVLILRSIINSYIKAKNDSEQQKCQLEAANTQLQILNEKLRAINNELVDARAKLLENEEKLQTIFNNLHLLICIVDLKTSGFVNINPEFTDILGYSHEELLNRPFYDFIHPDDRQKTAFVIEDVLLKGKMVISFTNRYQSKGGAYRWFNWNAFPALEKGIAYAVAIDITDLMKTEQALKESNELLTLFIKNSPIYAFIKDVKKKKAGLFLPVTILLT